MSMIEQIVTDAKALEAEAIRSEKDAQEVYADFVEETCEEDELARKADEAARKAARKVHEEIRKEARSAAVKELYGMEFAKAVNPDKVVTMSCVICDGVLKGEREKTVDVTGEGG